MTLRLRLTLHTFVVVLSALLLSAGVAGVVLWRVEYTSIARQLSAQADALLSMAQGSVTPTELRQLPAQASALLENQGIAAAGRIYNAGVLRWKGGAAAPDSLDPSVLNRVLNRAFSKTQQAVTSENSSSDSVSSVSGVLHQVGDYLVYSRWQGQYAVQVGRNLEPLEYLLRRYALIAGLTLVLLSALSGAIVARQVRSTLRPLEQLAARVQELERPEPLPAQDEPGEIGALARALEHSLEALRAERERETLFLASASHELRTPVTAMLADLQHTLSRPRPPEELQAVLERTERTASRLRLLTGNLMTLTRVQRLEGGTAPRQFEPVDLLELAGEVVDLLQPLALSRDLDLWLDGRPVVVYGDATLLSSVLENLIGNALKFTPRGGSVQVWAAREPLDTSASAVAPAAWTGTDPDNSDLGAVLRVQDSGPGFSALNMPLSGLTGAFVRGQSTAEGFGLGLAVVRQVVEAHGGTLWLGQGQPSGALVVVRLPSSQNCSA